jgi:hypothetical protein
VVVEVVCICSRCVVVFFTCSCVTAIYVLYFALRVLCYNIYNVFVDSSRKGDTAIDSAREGCVAIRLGVQLLKKWNSFFKFSYFGIP